MSSQINLCFKPEKEYDLDHLSHSLKIQKYRHIIKKPSKKHLVSFERNLKHRKNSNTYNRIETDRISLLNHDLGHIKGFSRDISI